VWQQAAAQEDGDLLGIALVVFGLPVLEGVQVERMAQHAGNARLGTKSSEPVPGEETLHCHYASVSGGRKSLEKRLGGRVHVPMPHNLTVLAEDTDIHAAGMPSDAAVSVVLFGVKSHEGSSSSS
jgi:hypothetical protein